jgi:ribosomal protein L19
MEAIRIVEAGELKKDRNTFVPGDTIRVSVKVIEGEK